MKTLHKSKYLLPLIILAGYLLYTLLSKYVFSFLFSYITGEYLQYIEEYKTRFLIAAIAIVVFLAVKFYQKKIVDIRQQYYNFFAGNPMPMTIVDLDTNKFIAVNKAAIEIYGYSEKEFLALSISDIRVKEELDLMHQDLVTINHGLKKAGVRRHRKKNGEVILVEVSTSEVIFKNKQCRLFLACNVTEIAKAREEKKIAEEEKIKQQNFTSYILDNFPVDVAIFDKNHRYLFLNKIAIKDVALRKWLIGKDDFDYFRAKGTDMSKAEERRRKFLKAIGGESDEWIDEYVVDGKPKYMLRKFYPYHEDGTLKYVYGFGMNITEVKKAQNQRDEYIEQLEKLAFTTSHKIRQPICNLQGLISLLEMEKNECREVNNIIDCMKNSVTAMDDFTRDLAIKLNEYKQNLSKSANNVS